MIEAPAKPTRREALVSSAAVAVTVAASTAAPGAAFAATVFEDTAQIRVFSGRYVLPNDQTVEGFIARPRMKSRSDVVLLLHPEGQFGEASRRTAIRYAKAGYLVVAPDLKASFGRGRTGASHAALVAEAVKSTKALTKITSGSGRIDVVTM